MFLRYTYPALLWAGLILLLMMAPGKEFPQVSFQNLDKVVHVFLFSVQSCLFARGFIRQPRFISLRNHPVIFALLICFLYGAATELVQAYFTADRKGDVFDVIADCTGAGIGVLIFVWLYGKASYSR